MKRFQSTMNVLNESNKNFKINKEINVQKTKFNDNNKQKNKN